MPAHIHAELMRQYAMDAAETDTPWLRWQYQFNDNWNDCGEHPRWSSNAQYRRKPKTITINGYEVPEPLRAEPNNHTMYYYISLSADTITNYGIWSGNSWDRDILERGLMHLTGEAAETHARALLSFTETKK